MKNKIMFISSFIIVTIAVIIVYSNIQPTYSYSPELTELDRAVAQQAIIDEAMAFYYRGTWLQYDNDNIVSETAENEDTNTIMRRSAYFHQPEDATSQDAKYLVCGELVDNILYNAFGHMDNGTWQPLTLTYRKKRASGTFFNSYLWSVGNYVDVANACCQTNSPSTCTCHTDSAADAYDEEISVYYINLSENPQDDEITIAEIEDVIQPGDAITYRRSSGGHIGIYIGNIDDSNTLIEGESSTGIVIESTTNTGAEYNYTLKRDYIESVAKESDFDEVVAGTVRKSTLDSFLRNKVLKENHTVTELAVVRPLNKILDHGYNISTTTLNRRAKPKLVRSKTASVEKHESVNPGDTITYTINLKNLSRTEDYGGILITDTAPENTIYISCEGNCTKNSDHIVWNISELAKDSEISVSYTVKVKTTVSPQTIIVSDATRVNGITLNTIKTEVNRTLTSKMQDELKSIAKSNAIMNGTYETVEELINAVYSELNQRYNNNIAIAEINSASDIFDNYFTIGNNNNGVYYFNTENARTAGSTYIPGLFGGYNTIGTPKEDARHTSPFQFLYFDNRELSPNTTYNKTLMTGDIIVIKDSEAQTEINSYLNTTENNYMIQVADNLTLYLYLGKKSASSNAVEVLTMYTMSPEAIDNSEYATNYYKKPVIFGNRLSSSVVRSRLLDSLMGQDAYVILRPTYGMTSNIIVDVDDDGIMDQKDAQALAYYIVDGTTEIDTKHLFHGDLSDDGIIKMNDVVKILNG